MKKTKINIHLDTPVLDALKALRAKTGASMSELIRRAIAAYIGGKP